MSYNLVLQEEAILDLQEAFEWYEKQRKGLGYELIEEIEIASEKLVKHPENYTYINHKYRRIRINRFPYVVVYELESDRVIINSVLHMKQKPKH
ncbi:MAG: hypothetical protein JWQ96_732 [Segetibacter sp.]|nr:hypothetical protein [Segetibacter sp.]